MGSINATRTAQKVIAKVRSNELVKMGDIITEIGYAKSIKRHPSSVTNTLSYKKALALESKPLLEGIQKDINRFKEALANKDLNKEEVRTIVGSIDILIKNYQLLSGGATERQVFVLPSELIESNNIKTNDVNESKGLIEPHNNT